MPAALRTGRRVLDARAAKQRGRVALHHCLQRHGAVIAAEQVEGGVGKGLSRC
jgi:hypothetical protein